MRNVTVFEFGYHRGSSGSGLFRRHPPKPVNASDECPGPFLPPPLVPSVISTPGRWHSKLEIPVGPWLWPFCAGPRTVNSVDFPSRICLPMPSMPSIGSKITPHWQILPRPDGGLPRPTAFTPQTALALPRWMHTTTPCLGPGHLTVRTLRLRSPLLLK